MYNYTLYTFRKLNHRFMDTSLNSSFKVKKVTATIKTNKQTNKQKSQRKEINFQTEQNLIYR